MKQLEEAPRCSAACTTLPALNMQLQYVRYLAALPLVAAATGATGAKPNLVLIVAVRAHSASEASSVCLRATVDTLSPRARVLCCC